MPEQEKYSTNPNAYHREDLSIPNPNAYHIQDLRTIHNPNAYQQQATGNSAPLPLYHGVDTRTVLPPTARQYISPASHHNAPYTHRPDLPPTPLYFEVETAQPTDPIPQYTAAHPNTTIIYDRSSHPNTAPQYVGQQDQQPSEYQKKVFKTIEEKNKFYERAKAFNEKPWSNKTAQKDEFERIMDIYQASAEDIYNYELYKPKKKKRTKH